MINIVTTKAVRIDKEIRESQERSHARSAALSMAIQTMPGASQDKILDAAERYRQFLVGELGSKPSLTVIGK